MIPHFLLQFLKQQIPILPACKVLLFIGNIQVEMLLLYRSQFSVPIMCYWL